MASGTSGNEMESGEVTSQGVQCTICGKYLSSYSSLCDHKRIHTGDRPHVCQICNKRFTQKAHLMIHRRTHTGEKPYSCNICYKRFSQSSHLKNHKRIHTGEKAYLCQICNLGFNQKPKLEKHLLSHFAENRRDVSSGHDMIYNETTRSCVADRQDSYPKGRFYDKQEFYSLGDANATPANLIVKKERLSPLSDAVADEALMTVVSELDKPRGEKSHVNKRKSATVKRIHPGHNSDVDADDSLERSTVDLMDNNLTNLASYAVAEFSKFNPEIKFTADVKPTPDTDPDDDLVRGFIRGAGNTESQVTSTETRAINSGSDDIDRASNASESNYSSDTGGNSLTIPTQRTTMMRSRNLRPSPGDPRVRVNTPPETPAARSNVSKFIRTNNRVCLVDFSTDDLLTHLMSRDDVHKCTFCCVVFQDQAMFHLHRSMHDKFDIRACNLCGKVARDKHDFVAHFLTEHK